MKKIIEDCREKMYDAIWLELDRYPQRPAVARVDIKTKAGKGGIAINWGSNPQPSTRVN